MLLLIAFYCDIERIPVQLICNDLMESLLYIAQRLPNNNIRLCTGLLRKSRSVCFADCKAKQFVGNQVILSCLFRIRGCVRGTCPRYSALLLTLHVKLSRLGELNWFALSFIFHVFEVIFLQILLCWRQMHQTFVSNGEKIYYTNCKLGPRSGIH